MARQMLTMRIEGVRELHDTLKDFAPNEVRNVMRGAVQDLAELGRDGMKSRVKKRTGRIAKSLVAMRRRGERNLYVSDVRVGHDAPYGLILEFGTRNTKAQPYIIPTLEELRGKVSEFYRVKFFERVARALELRAKRAARVK